APLAPEHQRAGTFAAIYVAAYLSLGLPVVVAGAFIGSFGLLPTMLVWTGSIVALAVVGFFIQLRRRWPRGRGPGRPDGQPCGGPRRDAVAFARALASSGIPSPAKVRAPRAATSASRRASSSPPAGVALTSGV